MIDDFHKAASEHFTSKGRDLAASLSTVDTIEDNTFKGPKPHSVAVWHEVDVLDFVVSARIDSDGREVARYGVIGDVLPRPQHRILKALRRMIV
ncbi:MAG: hypothetical protein ACE5GN_05235, partial [Waddliaceae bacterium]